jgi:hypothetical protein
MFELQASRFTSDRAEFDGPEFDDEGREVIRDTL